MTLCATRNLFTDAFVNFNVPSSYMFGHVGYMQQILYLLRLLFIILLEILPGYAKTLCYICVCAYGEYSRTLSFYCFERGLTER